MSMNDRQHWPKFYFYCREVHSNANNPKRSMYSRNFVDHIKNFDSDGPSHHIVLWPIKILM